jgi:hypothetical protein
MSDIDQPLWTYYSEELPRVWKHLERHYRVAPFFPLDDASFIVVLARSEDRGATLVDLVDESSEARGWIREVPGGEPVPAAAPPRLAARHNRRALPMRVGRFGGGIDYEVRIPEAGPPRSHMKLSVGSDGVFETVLDARVDDSENGGRTWTPVEADLSRWGGERVTLRLELEPESPISEPELSWWGSPRLAGPRAGK